MTRYISAIAATIIIAGSMAILPSTANAQNTTVLSKDSSKCDIFRAISRVIPGQCAPGYQARKTLMRSLVRRNVKQAPPAPVVQDKPISDLAAALSIQFAHDSAELTPAAITVLDRMASVLNDELMDTIPFMIEGHADRTGSDEYNFQLSQRRAAAVKSYLVEMHGVDAARLKSVGHGSSRLFDPSNPYSQVNRRVEFKNLGG